MADPAETYRPTEPSVPEIAAGGVVYHGAPPEILVLHVRDQDRWGFPKGHLEPGESTEAAARREILEETGLTELEFDRELTEVHYRFFDPRRGLNVFKTVVYWKVRSASKEVRLEAIFDRALWGSPRELLGRMTFPTDRAVIERFLEDSGRSA
ncbi:MAG TPA: NUDIX domain-containing protein [Thermoplasmata archaeon]|nr:NUDIX domain-containing protein [Thermoplasmata archaeon]